MVYAKVCGITTPREGTFAAESGADAIGLVFAESLRRISVEEAREITAALPEGILKVGVFVNAEPAEVLRIAREVGLDYAQLHGDESPEDVDAVREGGLKVMKALRVRGAESLGAIDDYGADLFLLDAWGGGGGREGAGRDGGEVRLGAGEIAQGAW